MDWVCLLLDAHFTVLVMTPEAKDLLLNLHNFVKYQVTNILPLCLLCNWLIVRENSNRDAFLFPQVRLVSELGKIESSLQELNKMKVKKDVGLYSIEVIELF